MAALFKDIYNQAFFDELTTHLAEIVPDFPVSQFLANIQDDTWESQALKQRMHRIAEVLHDTLALPYLAALDVLLALVARLLPTYDSYSLAYMTLPHYIAQYGLAETACFEQNMQAFEKITQLASCEFAVRPFIMAYPKRMMAQMLAWTLHSHPAVRRLASEGCRPRLPWAMALPDFKKDPSPILPILHQLKDDAAVFVQKSVANNLNDIAKDHPDVVIALAKQWQGDSKQTNWIIKHGCRTLLKQGHAEVMQLFGFHLSDKVTVADFELDTPILHVGDDLVFRFSVCNSEDKAVKLRLEYAVYYQKQNGSLSKKVYKISEKKYPKKSITQITRKQSFKPITTKKFYMGHHQVAVIINGKEFEPYDFQLVEAI